MSTAHWMFGNLYEEIVFVPPSLVHPRPGALVRPLQVGSPLWYYGPTLPVAVVGSWVTAARAGADPEARRRTPRAAAAVTAAGVLKAVLITRVNPAFRDPALTPDVVRDRAKLWLAGNGATVAALAAGLVDLLAWRRIPAPARPAASR